MRHPPRPGLSRAFDLAHGAHAESRCVGESRRWGNKNLHSMPGVRWNPIFIDLLVWFTLKWVNLSPLVELNCAQLLNGNDFAA